MRVLVIDDEEVIRAFVTTVLESMGHEFDVAANGEEGLRKAAESAYHLVLLDLVMPVKDGEATLKELRKCCPDTHVVMASVQDSEDAIRELLDLGAAAYLTKPFTAPQLEDVIREIEAMTAE